MNNLKIRDTVIPYEVKKNKRSRSIRIAILSENVRVTVPNGIKAKQINDLLDSKKEWILKNWQVIQQKKELNIRQYTSGCQLPYRGKTLTLHVEETARKNIAIRFSAKDLVISVYLPLPVVEAGVRNDSDVRDALIFWYKTQARKILREKLDYYSCLMGVQYQGMRIKEQKTRWGSCSSKGNINLNWHLLLAPEDIINYVVIHELAHLKYFNHSPEFWALVEEFSPEYKKYKMWLKKNGESLTL